MRSIRNAIKQILVLLMGTDVRPRRILRGIARGCHIVVSPKDHLGYLMGTRERHLQRILRRYVKEGDVAYDIGANIGYVTLSLCAQVGTRGKVYAFEPLPDNLDRLRKGIAASGKSNVTVFDLAASDTKGTAVIRTAGSNAMASLIWHREKPGAKEYTIRTERVDDLVDSEGLPFPAFLKIDVEGAEGQVVEGMTRTITASLPVIFIECSDTGREITWRILKGLGYKCESAITGIPVEQSGMYRHGDYLWLPPGVSGPR